MRIENLLNCGLHFRGMNLGGDRQTDRPTRHTKREIILINTPQRFAQPQTKNKTMNN